MWDRYCSNLQSVPTYRILRVIILNLSLMEYLIVGVRQYNKMACWQFTVE